VRSSEDGAADDAWVDTTIEQSYAYNYLSWAWEEGGDAAIMLLMR